MQPCVVYRIRTVVNSYITLTEQVLLIEEESLLIGYKNKWKQTTDNTHSRIAQKTHVVF